MPHLLPSGYHMACDNLFIGDPLKPHNYEGLISDRIHNVIFIFDEATTKAELSFHRTYAQFYYFDWYQFKYTLGSSERLGIERWLDRYPSICENRSYLFCDRSQVRSHLFAALGMGMSPIKAYIFLSLHSRSILPYFSTLQIIKDIYGKSKKE